jgi:hypothetical protein
VNFVQWSSEHSHIARIVVNYSFGAAQAPNPVGAQPLDAVPAVIAGESAPNLSQQATLVTNSTP